MSDFRKRKLRTFFTIFNPKRDQPMSKDDWVQLAVRFSSFEKADKKKAEHLKTQFANTWDEFFKHCESKEERTRDEFAEAIANQRYDPGIIKSESAVMRGFFDLLDVNCDGYLQEDEYARIFIQLGAHDASFTKEMFKAIDTNGDGNLSYEEFMNAYFDFLFSEDEKSPNRHFFGPLVD